MGATDITVASTTDTQEAINEAAGLPADGGEQPPKEEATTGGSEPAQNPPESEPGKSEAEVAAQPKPAAGSEPAKEEDGKQGKGNLQKRFDRLTERNYTLQEENENLRRQLQEVQKATTKPEAEAKPEEKPVREQFKSDAEFYEALGRWGAKQEVAASKQQTAEEEHQAYLQKTYDVYNKAVRNFRSEHDDFDEVVGREDLQIPEAVQVAIVELGDAGPAVAYYLGQNPEVCDKLGDMSDARAVVEVGRIAVALEKATPAPAPVAAAPAAEPPEKPAPAAPAPKRQPVSRAPAPTPAARTSATVATPMDELPYQDFKKERARQIRAARGR